MLLRAQTLQRVLGVAIDNEISYVLKLFFLAHRQILATVCGRSDSFISHAPFDIVPRPENRMAHMYFKCEVQVNF